VRNTPAAIAGEIVSLLVMIAGIIVTAQHAPQIMGTGMASPGPGEPAASESSGGQTGAS
jgi:hypothetical protein